MRLPVNKIEETTDLGDGIDALLKALRESNIDPLTVRNGIYTIAILQNLASTTLDVVSPSDSPVVKEVAMSAYLRNIAKGIAVKYDFDPRKRR